MHFKILVVFAFTLHTHTHTYIYIYKKIMRFGERSGIIIYTSTKEGIRLKYFYIYIFRNIYLLTCKNHIEYMKIYFGVKEILDFNVH